jgi:GNAT superfamily N-acetyltransferase
MPELSVRTVATRRERKLFLGFPWVLYRNDPNWIPPLRRNQEELVGYRRHPFYERNQVQTFLAFRGDTVCGRIAAIINYGHIERYQEQRGFFGFFECFDDQEAATALLDAARRWLAERGVDKIRGPVNPSMNYEVAALVEGFDSPPTFMMTYNPPYYGRLFETYGLQKVQDLYAFWGNLEMLPKTQAKLAPVAEQIIAHLNLRLRPLDRAHFLQDVETFLQIYNRSLTNTWGFVPMSEGEVRHMAGGLRFLIVPELSLAAELDGQVVGAVFGLPDYNPRIRQIDGRLFPFGFLRLLRNKQAIKRIRLISTNVLPEYQRYGIGLALMYGLVPKAMEWGMQEAEFSWVLESNLLSRGSLEKGGAKRVKTYRLYDLDGPPVRT